MIDAWPEIRPKDRGASSNASFAGRFANGRPAASRFRAGRASGPRPSLFAKDDALNMTHVFAAHGNHFVDCHTHGKIEEFKETPADMKNFKLKAEIFFKSEAPVHITSGFLRQALDCQRLSGG